MAKKLTYEEVKSYIENQGYQLLSTEYKNSRTKLEIKCSQNHIFEMKYACFQQGQRCPYCYGNKKLTYLHVKEYIELHNYKLISKEYKNCMSKLKIKCPKGHISKIKYNDFQQGIRCPIC